MVSDLIPLELYREVAAADVVAHAELEHWDRVSLDREDLAVFNDPDGSFSQVIIPLTTTSDYPYRVAEAVRLFAAREDRPATQILNDLLARSADVLRFRIAIPGHDIGSVPFIEGVRLYEGMKQSILSAARGAMSPQKVYSKLTTPSAEEFLKRCRLGQTERGSYIATVSCPMSLLPERQREEIPFARQTTSILLNTMDAMANALRNGREEELLELQDENVVVSANLCEAIASMQPIDERGTLTVQCSWAPSVRVAPQAPAKVLFHAENRDTLARIAQKLKSHEPQPLTEYVASIEGLKSEPDPAKRRLGVITVKISDLGEVKTVRMEVAPADYRLACNAHRDGLGVTFRARLIKGVRTSRIEEYRDFRPMERLPDFQSQSH